MIFNVINYLIKECKINTHDQNEKGSTPLHIASYEGHIEIVKYLIETCKVDLNVNYKDGISPLHFAFKQKHHRIVKYLIEHGSNAEVKENYRITSLYNAAKEKCEDIVKYLIEECKVDLNIKDNDECIPLHIASKKGYSDIVNLT